MREKINTAIVPVQRGTRPIIWRLYWRSGYYKGQPYYNSREYRTLAAARATQVRFEKLLEEVG